MSGPPQSAGEDAGLAVCLASSFFGHYAHLGLLEAMEAAGVRPGRIAGASAGALAGGLWAGGLRGEALDAVVHDFHFLRSFFDLGAFLRWPGVLTGLCGSGLLDGSRLRRYLSRVLGPDLRLEDLSPTSLEIAVSNVTRRKGEIRGKGPLVDLMIASCSMPVLFRPKRVEGEEFLDGGVTNETPFDHWLEDPSVHTIIVHRIRHTGDMKGLPWRTPGWVIGRSHEMMAADMLRQRLSRAAASGKKLHFLETRHAHPGILPGRKAWSYRQAGRETFQSSALAGGLRHEIPLSPAGRAS